MAPSEDIWTTPAIEAPDGQTSDFNSPIRQTWAPLFFSVTSVFMALAIVCVLLKLYIRLYIHKQPGLDDLCIAFAVVFQVVWTAVSDDILTHGAARHEWDMSQGHFTRVMKIENALNIIQMPTYMFTKLALLLLYYRLFSAKIIFMRAVLAGCAVVVCVYLAFMLIFILVKDFDAAASASYGLGCINLFTDVYLWLLPLAAISSLHLPWDRKIGVAGLFSAGALACAMSALSLYNRFNVDYLTLNDWTYDYARCQAIIAVEIYVGIMVGCVPIFPSLLRTTSVAGSISKAVRSLRNRMSSGRASRTTYGSHDVGWGKGSAATSSTAARMSRGDMYAGSGVDGQGQHEHEHQNQHRDQYQHEMQPLETGRLGVERCPTPEYQRPPFNAGNGSVSILSVDSLYAPSIDSQSDEGGNRIWSAGSVSPV